MTRKKFFSVLAALFMLQMPMMMAQSIYQLPNGGFETWYRETSNANSIVPTGFNSFYSADGEGLALSMGKAQRCDSSRDVRNGASGTFSLRLFSTTVPILNIRANGNVTSGRMYMGATSALNVNNYNFTDYGVDNSTTPPNPSKFCPEITGTPDSMRVWVKYLPGRNGTTNTTDYGRIRAYIHGTGECRDAPIFPSGKVEEDYYYGKAVKEFYKEDGGWHCYTVPFEYTGNNTTKNANGNYYVLLSMTTNMPGGGANNIDEVWFDDIEFVYSAYLSDLKINGTTIADFEKGILDYAGPTLVGQPPYTFPYDSADFTWVTEVSDIVSVEVKNIPGIGGDADGGYTSILITAEDSVTTKEYKIHYASNRSNDNNITALAYSLNDADTIHIPNFISSQPNYNITLAPEEVRTPVIVDTSIVLSDINAEIFRIVQPTGVNSVGSVTVRAEDYSYKTYTFNFSKALSNNSKLNWIKIGGVDIANFHADTLIYNTIISTCLTTFPTITYEKASAWSNITRYTPATMTNQTATIVVTAENGDSTVYRVNFVLTNDNTTVTRFRYGTSSTNQINIQPGVFVYESAYSFTAAPNALTPTLDCSAATFSRTPASNVFYPDTNYLTIKAQNLTDSVIYKIVIKNTNCFLATGNNNALKYNYNGLTDQNTAINITSNNNNNLNPVTTSVVTLPIGPNVPAELNVIGFTAAVARPTVHIQQATSRTDTAIITLTANDGVTQKVYRVPFRPTFSTDATLKGIKYVTDKEYEIIGFVPTTEKYTIILPSSVDYVPNIQAAPNFQWLADTNIVIEPAATLSDTTKITVTAENGSTTKTYLISFEVIEQEDDAYLLALKYDNEFVPNFNPLIYDYNVDIPYTSAAPVISATSSSPTALPFYVQPTVEPYIGKVLVYSENMQYSKIYTVNFNKVKNTNAALADIKVNGVSLSDFNPNTTAYNVELEYTELTAPVVAATPAYQYANVNITQIDTIMGTVTIAVNAEDTNYKAAYTIDFTRESSPVINIDTVKYVYNNQTYAYKVTANMGTTITIMLPVETEGIPNITDIVLSDNRSDFAIGEQPDIMNNLTGTVTVTAENLTIEMYEISFVRALSSSTLLTGISYNLGGTTYPLNFNPDTLNYTVILPFNTVSIPVVSAVLDWKNTDTLISQISSVPWLLPLAASIQVTSEDGLNNKTYTVTFIQQGNVELSYLSYNLGGRTYPIPAQGVFDPSTLVYNITLPLATEDIPVLEFGQADNRVQSYQNTLLEPNGTIQLTLTTAHGIPDTLTYTVSFEVALSTEALLSDLQVDGITIENFDANTLNYFVEYEYGTETLPKVTAVATQPDAKVEISEITEYPGIVSIKVYAGDTSISQTYSISFSVEMGNNAKLDMITLDENNLYSFNPNVYEYEDVLPRNATLAPEVKAVAQDERATVSIEQNNEIPSTAVITVTAYDEVTTETYYVHFKFEPNMNAWLSAIIVDGDTLPNFAQGTMKYEVSLSPDYFGTPIVTAVAQDTNATVVVDYFTQVHNEATITVTAENQITIRTYQVAFHSNLSIDECTMGEIKYYPNPVTDVLTVEMDSPETFMLKIVDNYGRIIMNTSITGNAKLDISDLASGMYIITINNKPMGKFIKIQ